VNTVIATLFSKIIVSVIWFDIYLRFFVLQAVKKYLVNKIYRKSFEAKASNK